MPRTRFLRASLREVEPYTPGEQPKLPTLTKLNTNENPYPPPASVLRALAELDGDRLRRYPDPVALELRRAAAELYGCAPENVIATNGSDELLRLVLTAFVEPGDAVVLPDVTYSLYETLIAIHGATMTRVPLRPDFSFDEAMVDTAGALMFLCHPNAPTGQPAAPALIEAALERFAGVVVVDEAYADFAERSYASALPRRHDNVIVLRTLSKSYSLAGMRVGVGLADAALIDALMAVKDSYNLDVAAQVTATAALRDQAAHAESLAKIKATRARLTAALRALGLDPLPSQANFVLTRMGSRARARSVWAALRADGILVRYFDRPRVDDCLRISVGADAEIDRLLARLEVHLASAPG
ncbi:MAG: histidinol-phosphate transaminase [Myxococcales bacterium]|nr:histidinol-phosphate transaminase [Myxococcales bacterium]MCB9748663.1 histidinol-phosphate transaminase [Myxococcales bacterium]